jgi:hypothetical protein
MRASFLCSIAALSAASILALPALADGDEVVPIVPAPPAAPAAAPALPTAVPLAAPLSVAATPPPPVVPADAPPPPAEPPPSARSRPEINIAAGFREIFIPSAGLDPFSTGNAAVQLSLAVGPTLLRSGRVSLAAMAEWDVGTLGAMARGDESSLTMHRLGIGIESRFELARRLTLFAKVAPAAVNLRATLVDPGLDRPLVSRSWTWALDTTGGLAFMFASVGSRSDPSARFWFTAEGGYGFAGSSDMIFTPEASSDDPRHYGSVMLPSLRPSGGVGRLAMMVSF